METIRFWPQYIPSILAGEKTQTRRWGRRACELGKIIPALNSETGKSFAHLKIQRVFEQSFQEMSEEEAKMDGFTNKEGFWADFSKIYPEATLEERFTVVEFQRVSDEEDAWKI